MEGLSPSTRSVRSNDFLQDLGDVRCGCRFELLSEAPAPVPGCQQMDRCLSVYSSRGTTFRIRAGRMRSAVRDIYRTKSGYMHARGNCRAVVMRRNKEAMFGVDSPMSSCNTSAGFETPISSAFVTGLSD